MLEQLVPEKAREGEKKETKKAHLLVLVRDECIDS